MRVTGPNPVGPTNQPVMLAAAAVMLVVVMVLVVGQLAGLDQLLEVGTVVLGRSDGLGAALKLSKDILVSWKLDKKIKFIL